MLGRAPGGLVLIAIEEWWVSNMQRLRIQRFTTAGVALATTALFVAACARRRRLGRRSTSGSGLSGTLNGSGSTLQLAYQQQAIQSFKAIQPS